MKKKLLASVLALAMAAASITGCGNSSSNAEAAGSASTKAATETASKDSDGTATTASTGKALKIGVPSMSQNISPFTNFTNRQPVLLYLYETLMEKDAEGNMVGILAKEWSTKDNITYDIEIYDYIKDTDGNAITAEDVVYSLEHARDEAANTWIASAKVTGDYTLTVTLTDDAESTLWIAMNRAPIVSKKAYEASADSMATSCVNTAPYMVTAFVPNVSITFEKNPNYWQTDESLQNPVYKNMTVEKMEYTKIAEAAQQTIALETGTIDAFSMIATTEVGNFLEGGRDAENYTALGYASPTSYCFYYANQGICGEDINLRKAISYAIDKEAIILGAFGGLGVKPTFFGAPDGLSDLTPTSAGDDYFAYNQEMAKEYLAKSGYKGEKLRLLIPNEDNHNRIAAVIQGQLMAIGLDVELTSFDNAMFQANFVDGSTWDISVCQMGLADITFVWKFLSWDLSGGDKGAAGMAIKDEKLKELLTTVNTVEGHTTENATIASDYINEQALGQNLVSGQQYFIFRKDLGAKEILFPFLSVGDFYIGCTTFE